MKLLNILKAGQEYAMNWTVDSLFAKTLPEYRVIKMTHFTQKVMPIVAVASLSWWWLWKGNWGVIACATAMMALLMPMQGWYWLGKRALKPLSEEELLYFKQVSQSLVSKKVDISSITTTPCYKDLVILLQLADKHLGTEFWQVG